MKHIQQFLLILLFTAAGEFLTCIIPLPIPAAIYGLLLMLLALCTGILKTEHIDDTARFLIRILPLLFVAPGVNLLRYWGLIAPNVAAILIICVVSTFLVFAVSGLVTQLLLKRKGGERDD